MNCIQSYKEQVLKTANQNKQQTNPINDSIDEDQQMQFEISSDLPQNSNKEKFLLDEIEGFINKMQISDSPDGATITASIESRLITLERSKVTRYTDQSQRADYPTDTFFSYVSDIQDKDVPWGRKA